MTHVNSEDISSPMEIEKPRELKFIDHPPGTIVLYSSATIPSPEAILLSSEPLPLTQLREPDSTTDAGDPSHSQTPIRAPLPPLREPTTPSSLNQLDQAVEAASQAYKHRNLMSCQQVFDPPLDDECFEDALINLPDIKGISRPASPASDTGSSMAFRLVSHISDSIQSWPETPPSPKVTHAGGATSIREMKASARKR